MCGIIGLFDNGSGARDAVLTGLTRMEYRGYDSAGMALAGPGPLTLIRALGKVSSLAEKSPRNLRARAGIGHTRWATHGKPSIRNAHPHLDCAGSLALVHNGIIENYRSLKAGLLQQGHHFRSETDSEVLSHLLESALQQGLDPLSALSRALEGVKGSVACLALIAGEEEPVLLAGRKAGGPLLVGRGPRGWMAASDPLALAGLAEEAAPLPDHSCARLYPQRLDLRSLSGARKKLALEAAALPPAPPEREGYAHFMLKEIHEQGRIAARILKEGPGLIRNLRPRLGERPSHILILGCGTSWHAGLLGRVFFEELAGIRVRVEYASEFRSQSLPPRSGTLVIAISQSGETADTLAAAQLCRDRGLRLLSLVNNPASALARLSDAILPLLCGPEVGVASTKAFTAEVLLLLLSAMALAPRGRRMPRLRRDLRNLPIHLARALRLDRACRREARLLAKSRNALFLGRSYDYPLALEGALKLKEISYVHAEGLPAGEVKHGPIALVESAMPVIVVANAGTVLEKSMSNVQEVLARGARVLAVGNAPRSAWPAGVRRFLPLPRIHPFLASLLAAVPLQLLAYHAASRLGRDVDRPRNLAKSVTVE